MGFLNSQSFGFFGSGGSGGSGSTPSWQQVTTVGNTTTDDIFVEDGSANEYLTVDKTNDIYYLGNPVSGRAISINAATQAYLFGESAGVNIAIDGSAGTITFAGTTAYRFSNSIASYASGTYAAVVLNTDATPNVLQLQPKDLVPITTKTADYTATNNDCVILVNNSAAPAITITLPTSVLAGKRFFIKMISSASFGNVIVDPAGSATIDGSANFTISTQYESIECIFDGTNYWII